MSLVTLFYDLALPIYSLSLIARFIVSSFVKHQKLKKLLTLLKVKSNYFKLYRYYYGF